MAPRNAGFLSVAAAALVGVACGSSSGAGSGGDAAAGSTGDGAGQSSTSSGSSSGADSGAVPNFEDASGSSSGGSFVGCATTTQKATPSPLDLYFMIDTSASMDDLVAAGESKWSAITAAMTTFVDDPASAGIGVGLQFFPLTAAGVPASCTSSAQCGTGSPCLLTICANQQEVITCSTAADCPRGGPCVSIGECQNDHNYLCQDPGNSQCNPDPNGFALGACQVLTSSTCVNGDSCSAQDYATPAVA